MTEKNENLFVADIADDDSSSYVRGVDVGRSAIHVIHGSSSTDELRDMINSMERPTTSSPRETKWERFCKRLKRNWGVWLINFCMVFIFLFVMSSLVAKIIQESRYSFKYDVFTVIEHMDGSDLDGDGEVLDIEVELRLQQILLEDFNILFDLENNKIWKDGDRIQPEDIKDDLKKYFQGLSKNSYTE